MKPPSRCVGLPALWVVLLLGCLAACSSPKPPAPIVDRSAPVAPVVIHAPQRDRPVTSAQAPAKAAKPVETAKPATPPVPKTAQATPQPAQSTPARDPARVPSAETGREARRDPVKDSDGEVASVRPIRNPEVVSMGRDVPSEGGSLAQPGRPEGAGRSEPRPAASPEPRPATSPEARPLASPEPRPTTSPEARPLASPEPRPAASSEPRPAASPESRPAATPEIRFDPPPAAGRVEGAPEAEWVWPAEGKTVHTFSAGKGGVRIEGSSGDPIVAIGDGKVIFAGQGPKGYGNLLIVRHEGELLSVYAHNRALMVQEGSQVRKGQKIAEMGDSGADRAQLGFELRRNGRPIDPRTTLPAR